MFRNVVDYGMTIDDAVNHGRIHHQWHPDKVRIERLNPPPKATLDDLVKRGHSLQLDAPPMGDANEILVDASTGTAWAFADPREGGKAAAVAKVNAKP